MHPCSEAELIHRVPLALLSPRTRFHPTLGGDPACRQGLSPQMGLDPELLHKKIPENCFRPGENPTWKKKILAIKLHIWAIVPPEYHIWKFMSKSKQMVGSAGGKSYAYIWRSFDFKPFLLNDHYCKVYEVWVWRHSDNYFYIILIFEWSQVWFLASPFLGKP